MTLSVPSASEFPTYIRQLRLYTYYYCYYCILPQYFSHRQYTPIYTRLYIRLYIIHCIPPRLIANRNKCCECDDVIHIQLHFYSYSINYWHYHVYRVIFHIKSTFIQKTEMDFQLYHRINECNILCKLYKTYI